jgi:DNA-binding NtrC family response regulator
MPLPSPKILIVDDEPTVCYSLGQALAGQGYDIEAAESGEEALRKIEAGTYGVVICDLMMPGLSGLDLLKNLRDRDSKTPVVLVTGYPTSRAAAEASKLGAFDFLMKPFTPEDIRGVVRRALGA